MKRNYEEPEIEIKSFDVIEDIALTISGSLDDGRDWGPLI